MTNDEPRKQSEDWIKNPSSPLQELFTRSILAELDKMTGEDDER